MPHLIGAGHKKIAKNAVRIQLKTVMSEIKMAASFCLDAVMYNATNGFVYSKIDKRQSVKSQY